MTIAEQIEHHMALAFFASAWADYQDEKEDGVYLGMGTEVLDVVPEVIDPAAIHAARTLALGVVARNEWLETLGDLLDYVQYRIPHGGDRPRTPEMIGHYLAMQAMGHGVGLDAAFGKVAYETIYVPYVDFGAHSLQNDY